MLSTPGMRSLAQCRRPNSTPSAGASPVTARRGALGALPERARMGHRARGLQRGRRGLELFPHDQARSRAYRWSEDGLGGICDADSACAWRSRSGTGRTRSSRSGSSASRQRGQPRRGRQGVLVVRRLHAHALLDALALRLSPARVPLRGPRRRRTPAAGSATPSTSCSTPARSTTTATGTSPSTTPRPGRTTSACACASATPGPTRPTLHVLPTLWFRNTWSWDDGARAAGHREDGGAIVAHDDDAATDARGRRRARAAVLRQRVEHAAAVGPGRPALSEGRHQRPRGDRRADRQSRRTGTKAALRYRLRVDAGETAECGCG